MNVSEREKYVEAGASRWWRFDRYQIQDGFIRPAANASLSEFDPWLAHSTHEGYVHQPPYLQLAELVRQVPSDRALRGSDIESDELRSGVLSWCQRYGLLGILTHEVLSEQFGSRVLKRTVDGWVRERGVEDELAPWGQVVVEHVEGEMLLYSEDYWSTYLPSLEGNWESSPLPLTEEFWRAYGEPLPQFLRVALFIANAIRSVAEGAEPVAEYREEPLDGSGGMARLNQLTSAVSPSLADDSRGGYAQRWRSPSMLGYLAMQFVEDTLARRVVTCDCCARPFASDHWRARFCSPICADRQRQREWRKRDKRRKTARRPQRSRER